MKETKTVIQEIIDAQNADPFNAEATTDALTDALDLLEKQPEIVRCKDCKYATMTIDGKMCKYCAMDTDDYGYQRDVYHDADWFCADGERRRN